MSMAACRGTHGDFWGTERAPAQHWRCAQRAPQQHPPPTALVRLAPLPLQRSYQGRHCLVTPAHVHTGSPAQPLTHRIDRNSQTVSWPLATASHFTAPAQAARQEVFLMQDQLRKAFHVKPMWQILRTEVCCLRLEAHLQESSK